MAYQLALDYLRHDVTEVTVPCEPSSFLLTAGEEEEAVAPENIESYTEILSNYLFQLWSGEDPRGTLLRWDDLMDPNLRVDPRNMNSLMRPVVQLNTKDAKQVAEMLTRGSAKFSEYEANEFEKAIKRLIQPVGRYERKPPESTSKGPTLALPFAGPLQRQATSYAANEISSKFPQNGNLSFTRIRGNQGLVDGLLEQRYSLSTQEEMKGDQFRSALMARAFYDGLKEAELSTDQPILQSSRALRLMMDEIRKSGLDPNLLLGALLSRNQQYSFGISVLGTSLSVQVPWTDKLCRGILKDLTEIWQSSKNQPRILVTTSRVDGNLIPNLVDHINNGTAFEHYDKALVLYRHTDRAIFVFDYDNITQKLVFLSYSTCDLTVEQLEGIPGAKLYQASRGPDGKLKAGTKLSFPQSHYKKLSKYLRPIKRAWGWDLRGSMIPKIVHIEGICRQLKKDPKDMGCWKHMINGGGSPKPEDADKLMDATLIEVLALLSLWYRYPFHFQFDLEPLLDFDNMLLSLSPVLGHVVYADLENSTRIPQAVGSDTVQVTLIANKNHELWNRRCIWGWLVF